MATSDITNNTCRRAAGGQNSEEYLAAELQEVKIRKNTLPQSRSRSKFGRIPCRRAAGD